tara:strand:+ start:161 stop:421 length:261 start_codon:yes stop_codon:yes gene_type:complete
MFTPKLPENATIDDFRAVKARITSQYVNISCAAPDRDKYSFGVPIQASQYKVKKAFANALRTLCETCLLQTGEELMNPRVIDQLEQ